MLVPVKLFSSSSSDRSSSPRYQIEAPSEALPVRPTILDQLSILYNEMNEQGSFFLDKSMRRVKETFLPWLLSLGDI
jgi:hypothetical protein